LLLFNLGVLLEDLGRTAQAVEVYNAAVSQDPTLADCHFNLAAAVRIARPAAACHSTSRTIPAPGEHQTR